MKKQTVSVTGLGYIGLPTAALLASEGHTVLGTDISQHAVETINQGKIHIVEPDLDAYVRSAVAAQRLKAFNTPQPADIYMICVPTPFHENGEIPSPNVDYVMSATRGIAPLLKAGDLVILESTSPVGTTAQMADVLKDASVDISQIYLAYCPERVLPGKIMTELVENDRIVGGLTPEATQKVASFYRSFVRGQVLETDAKTAEMCKLTENSFRDVNIAFANELSMICNKEGIDVWKLIELANHHPRVNILQPGTGVGGHCIAVDPWFIVSRDPENAKLIRAAREINDHKTDWVIDQIKIAIADATAKGSAKPESQEPGNTTSDNQGPNNTTANTTRPNNSKPKIACLGLAFKPDIDDLRESPALHVATTLQTQGFDVVAVEPNIESHDTLTLNDLDTALESCGVIAILVKHRQFLQPEVQLKLQRAESLDFCGALPH
jgi:UDP-N-acetyl-D-mannosaminuronic acid dehydrogenase